MKIFSPDTKPVIFLLAMLSLLALSCQKTAIEPPAEATSTENYVYIEYDGVKHLFTDRARNRNKKTKGIYAGIDNDVLSNVLVLSGNFYRPTGEPSEDFTLSMRVPFGLGVKTPYYFRFSSVALIEGDSTKEFQVYFSDDLRYSNNTVDTMLYIERIDRVNNAIKFRYEGDFIDYYNLKRHIKIISEIKNMHF